MADGISAAPRTPLSDTGTNVDSMERLAPGTRVARRYRIVDELGVGGMGVVYRARDEELGIDIALKALRRELGTDPRWIERFRLELVLAREVTHKNVVRIHDIGESDGLRFLTMSLVQGRSLLDVLEKEGRLTVERSLAIVRQVAEALQAAHDAGVVHRDLKPGNILLSPDDTAYVTDFGVARSLDGDGLTRPGAVVGTLDYLSPEQAAGRPVDGRSDIYALGVVLFEMLTGQLPFRGGGNVEVLAQRITGRPRDISDTGVRVPAYVRSVIRRCLERAPDRRYRNAHDLIADLEARRVRVVDRLPRRTTLMLAAVVAAGAGLVRLGTTGRTVPTAGSTSAARLAVAVLPLIDETGDPSLAWTGNGVAEILSAQLAESPDLRVLDPARVQRTLRDLGLHGAGEDEVVLRRLSGLLGAGRLVSGSLRRAGHTLRVDLRLVRVEGVGAPGVRAISAETTDTGRLFRVVADLGERLRRDLEASEEDAAPAAEPATTSLDAARAYREGRERLLIGDSVGAAPSLERAARLDPGFAEALYALSEAYEALGYRDRALAAAEKARGAAGASTRLAWRARARVALLRGDPATAETAYAELARRYPLDTEALLELAHAQTSQGATLRSLATLKRATELDRADPRSWLLLGKNQILAGEARQAVSDALVHALALMTQLGNEQGQADVLNAMGVGHQRLGEYPPAATRYAEAAAIRQRIGDQRGAAVSLKNRASVHLALGRLDDAEPDLGSAREIFTKIGDRMGLADVWNDFGMLHEGRGDYAGARRDYQAALRIRRELGDEHQLAQSYDNVGYIFFLEGDHDGALAYWRQALDLRRRNGDRAGVVVSTQNLGFLQVAQGRWPDAMRTFLDTLERAREIDFTNAVAVSLGNIALLHHYEGRYPAALAAYGEALKVLTGLDDIRGLTEYTIKEAQALTEIGRLDDAERRLAAVEAWLRRTGNREQSADLEAARGETLLARGRAENARRSFGRALELARSSRSRAAILRARIARASAFMALGDPETARPEAVSAMREADALGDALLRIRAAEILARVQLGGGRSRQAERSVRRALSDAENCGWAAGLPRLHALLGRIQEAQGNRTAAAVAYRESARRIARLREALPDDLRSSFDGIASVREVEAWLAAHP